MKLLTSLLTTWLLCSITAMAQITLSFDPAQRGHKIGDLHYGIFFEEINHAGDGGLYAELVRNRSFEDNDGFAESWSVEGGATMTLTSSGLANAAQQHALHIEMPAGATLVNDGYWGMGMKAGDNLKFSCLVKSTKAGKMTVAVYDGAKAVATKTIDIPATDGTWQKITITDGLTANSDISSGRLVMRAETDLSLDLDVVSLMPPTYKGRENGCRRDLAQMLADLKPSFMRFPGGCYIEGEYRDGSQNRFEWKKTIGAIEERPGHWNVNWNYRVSDGLGYHEMLQLSEDLGAAPLFVVNMGMGHGWRVALEEIDEYIQEALDALEYANGDASTKYGAMRIANGHPEPFNLKLIEIGNENYQRNANEQSWEYAERYWMFYQAIKAKYPDVVCIGNVEAWGTDNPTWRNSYPVDAVDEHYYRDPAWFVKAYDKYDKYDRNTMPKVYAGEYAVTSNFGKTGHLTAALGEAVYMQGMENNSDICVMASYAPIFVNVNDQKWMPDMIRFNSTEAFGTPSYHVQSMMANYVGKENIRWTESGNSYAPETASTGLSTWLTAAQFDNYTITLADGTRITPEFNGQSGWQSQGGDWEESNGSLMQYNTSMEGKMYLSPGMDLGSRYTIELDATKTDGKEGFLIAFNVNDANNYCWWNLGGWGNTKHAVEVCTNGIKTTVAEHGGYLATGQTYHLKITVDGPKVECYLDNELIHSFSLPVDRKVYVSSSIDDEAGKLYVKIVNPGAQSHTGIIRLQDYTTTGGKQIVMTSDNGTDENSMEQQDNVAPRESDLNIYGSQFAYDIPAYSISILVLDIRQGGSTGDDISVIPGNYYLKTTISKDGEKKEGYLSRGDSWGTRATIDRYGIPVNIARNEDGTHAISFPDNATANRFLGKDNAPYTDKNTTFPTQWTFEPADGGGLLLRNTAAGEYLMAGSGLGSGASFTADKNMATAFSLLSTKDYDKVLSAETLRAAEYAKCTATDITESVMQSPDMTVSMEGWSSTFSKKIACNYGVSEVFEGFGAVEQTVVGLKPGATYRFSVPALYRSGAFDMMNAAADNGMVIGNAYIYAGNATRRITPWVTERTPASYPNTMAEAAECFNEGRYQNSIVGRADEDGKLTIGICCPQNNHAGWLIWGKAMLEHVGEKKDCTNYINNPSFENRLTGWDSNMQTQNNSEVSAMKQGTYYCESWVKVPATLWDVYTRQTVTDLQAGRYSITAACHAENQGNNDIINGVYLYANDKRIEIAEPRDYDVTVDVTDGTLEFGVITEGTNANWVTADNFRLTWYEIGDNTEAYRAGLNNVIIKLENLLDTKKILSDKQKGDARKTISDARKAEDIESLKSYTAIINDLYKELKDYRLAVDRSGEDYKGYLFAYFPNNNDENLYFAYSDDAFNYTVLNNGQRVMASDTVSIKGGIRDPHILRGVDGKTFYMVATDMVSREGWASNRGIVMYKSTDLIHWQHSTVHFPDRFPNGWSSVTRVWAPEVIWDANYLNKDGSRGRYMVYFSLLTSDDGTCRYDKVYCCYANDDFTDLLDYPVHFYDHGSATIDADIVFDETDQLYHMIYKNEGAGGISHVTAETLMPREGEPSGSQWTEPNGTIQQTNVAVEGGGIFRLIGENTWVVMYDCYGSGYYQFCTTTDWTKYQLKAQTVMKGAFTPRHGTVLPITEQEYNRLVTAFPTPGLKPTAIMQTEQSASHAPSSIYGIDGKPITTPVKGQIVITEGKAVIY